MAPLTPHIVSAYNTAKDSENKMHDDTVARQFGFSGGLVPGVDVFAYMMHPPVAKWGRAFLERGLIEARFVKPVYDGETAEVRADEAGGVLTLEVQSRGELCATGSASLPASAPKISLADYPETSAVAQRKPGARVHAYEASPSTARWLERNVADNRMAERVTTHAVAVSDHHGTLALVDNVHASALNGLTAPGGTTVDVPCVSFASAVGSCGGHVDLLKLDTEGAEYDIVLPSDPAAWASVQRVVLEYHPVDGHSWEELRSFFAGVGLEVVRDEPVTDRLGTAWLSRTPLPDLA